MATESQAVFRDSLQSRSGAIDADVAEIRRLREARNSNCSHTRKLPREVLAMIFAILAEAKNEIEDYPLPGRIGCAVVTHVCRTWRNIALSEPSLWTDLATWGYYSSSPWVDELFMRSKAAPLSLSVRDHISDCYQRICEQVFIRSPERLKSLDIRHNNKYVLRVTKPMPYLESLSLVSERRLVLPDNFACGSTPRLRSLELGHVVVPIQGSWFSNVRTLSLWGAWSPSTEGRPFTVKEFLAMLSRLPRLVDLSVRLDTHIGATACASPGDVIRLSLQALSIFVGSSIRPFKQILQSIAMNTLQSFAITIWVIGDACGAISEAIDFFTRSIPSPSSVYAMKSNGMDNIFMTRLRDASEGYTFRLRAPLQYSKLSDYLPNMNITMLRLLPQLELFRNILPIQECQTIEEVQIDSADLLDDLLLLDPSNTVPYPSLRRLLLRKFITPKSEAISRLSRWIGERKRLSGFDKLILEECKLTAEDMALLAKTISVETIPS